MLKKISPREKFLLVVLGITGLVLILQKLIFVPCFMEYKENKLLLEQRNKEISYMGELQINQNKENEGALEAKKRLASFEEALPPRTGTGNVLVQLGMEAAKSHLKIISYRPMEEGDKKYYLESPARVKLSGLFPDVMDYLVRLEKNMIISNLLEIRDLTVQSKYRMAEAQLDGYPAQPGSVEAEFVLLVYSPSAQGGNLDVLPGEVSGWGLGRKNAFYPGVPGMEMPPPAIWQAGNLTVMD